MHAIQSKSQEKQTEQKIAPERQKAAHNREW